MSDEEREEAQWRSFLSSVKTLTEEMRSSDEGRWARVSERLAAEGIDPEDAVVADLCAEGSGLESGTVVSRDGRGFHFDFMFESGARVFYEDAQITEWEEEPEHHRELYLRMSQPLFRIFK